MNIIDFHAHSVLDEKSFSVTHHIMRLAKRCGIKHICLLGDVLRFGHNPPEKQVQAINDQTISLVKKCVYRQTLWHNFAPKLTCTFSLFRVMFS
jgi:hypothetical protein